MTAKKIVSKKLNVTTADHFVETVQSESAFFVFAARHVEYPTGDSPVPEPTDDVSNNVIDVYNNMLFGKKVLPTDVTQMIPRYDWTSNTQYAMYDDKDAQLLAKQFYACVNTGAQYHVYKCIYNNANAFSTIEPSGTDTDTFETSDGYIWKYMYSANSATMSKFATDTYLPVVVNTAVTEAATAGSIEAFAIEDSGLGYDNYLTGSFGSPTDLRISGSPYQYSIGANASTLNDFYNGCILLMTSGAAQGEYKIITDYIVTSGQRIVVLDDNFSGTVAVNDTFEIYPYVYIYDTGGRKQTNCIARALISNTTGNSVSKIEIIDPGSGYRAATAIIQPDPVVDVQSNAVLRAIISPAGGHGANVASELGASYVGISVSFIQNQEALTTENDFRQIGIIKDPLFANLNIKIDINNTIGNFAPGERIYQYRDIQLTGTVEVYSNSTVVGTNTYFDESLSVGDSVLITDGTQNIFANVLSIASNTQLTLTANAPFSNSGCSISLTNAVSYGVVTGNSAGEIFVSNVAVAGLTNSLKLVGEESFCTSVVNTAAALPVSINGRNPNNFNTFTQLTRFIGTIDSGAFDEDETVTQDAAISYAVPSARVYAVIDGGATDFMYVTNVQNIFQTNASPDSDGIVTGANSQASFTITAKYDGDLVQDSGEVVYLENLSPIARSNTQTETIKLILEF
jgi:hypothetical protein